MVDRIIHVEHRGCGVGSALAVIEGHAAVRAVDDQAKHGAPAATGPLHVDELDAHVIERGAQKRRDAGDVVVVHMWCCASGAGTYAVRGATRLLPGGGAATEREARAFSHATSSVLALKIELYVPVTMPMSSASTKPRIESPPKMTSDRSTNTTVSDVFSERVMVCTVERLITWSKVSRGPTRRFSRTRSKTTMVSWIEKATEVSTAVTKSEST